MGKPSDKSDLIYDMLKSHVETSRQQHNDLLDTVATAHKRADEAHARIDRYENRFWGGVTVLSLIFTTVGAIGATAYKKLMYIFA